MKHKNDELKLLLYTFLLCFVVFGNLYIVKTPHDIGAIVMAFVVCLLLGYSYFIIRKFFPDGDKYILLFSCIFCVIGIAMLYRLKPSMAINQVIWFTIGITIYILIVVLLPDLKSFSKYKYFYLVITLIFMSMATFLAKEQYGAKNWVKFGGFGFQPSEFGKLFLAAYLAATLKDYKNFKSLFQPAAVVMVTLGFMMLQRDLGSALIFFGLSVTMLYISTSKFKYVIVCLLLFIVGGVISYKLFGHVRLRVMIWKDPWAYANNEGLQVVQSLISIASGGFFGTGIGMGHPNYIPVVESDFIFAALCEELGMVVGFGIIILYFLLFYRCMRAAFYVEDKFSQLLAVGYSAMIGSQVLVIIGGVVGAIPLTGITLPFISYGGSSMLTTFFVLGILQKVSEDALNK
jgi:cell division protein FtsW (lipid II flippase)